MELGLNMFMKKKKFRHYGSFKFNKKIRQRFYCNEWRYFNRFKFLKFLKLHKKNKNNFTIASFRRKVKIDFGVLFTNKGNLKKFLEKPVNNFEVSMGIYAVNKSIIKYIPKNCAFGFDNLMKLMIKKKLKVSTYLHKGSWLDIGRQDDYFEAIDKFKVNKKDIFNER